MTKEVLVTVKGNQIGAEGEENIEIINAGTYSEKNGKVYIIYEEQDEANAATVRNQIKIDGKKVEIMKKGSIGAQMYFEENEKVNSCYETPYGNLMIAIYTKSIEVKTSENLIEIYIKYVIEMNGEYLSDSSVCISVKPRVSGNINLD